MLFTFKMFAGTILQLLGPRRLQKCLSNHEEQRMQILKHSFLIMRNGERDLASGDMIFITTTRQHRLDLAEFAKSGNCVILRKCRE